ncbi:MAG: porin, partial [Rickettsiaceae bacterium]|nr:porin [Rickettsiaceae bacterium]MDP5020564.1 porin [Rickettsiaceae bacterium]
MIKRKNLGKGFGKNIVISAGILCCTISSAFALDNIVKISAVMEVQGAHYDNNGKAEQQELSVHQKKYGLFSTGNLLVDYALESDSGLKYGFNLGIEQTTRNNRGTPLSIYIESSYGRIEAGSGQTAAQKMRITGYTASCAAGGGWDMYVQSSPKQGADVLVPYVTNFCSFLDSKARTSRKTDYARSITYFTPKLGSKDHTLQLGVTYIPDNSNAGHGDVSDQNLHSPVAASQYKFAMKDGLSYGAVYAGKLSDLLSAKLAFVGERGKPIAFNKKDSSKANVKFKDLNTYNIGAEVTYDKLSVAGSYMDYNKSLTNAEIDKLGRNTGIYSAGMKYNFQGGKYIASLNYFYSNHQKNKLDATSAGIDYLITKGIKTYAQLTYYKTKGRFIDN